MSLNKYEIEAIAKARVAEIMSGRQNTVLPFVTEIYRRKAEHELDLFINKQLNFDD